MSNEVDMSRVLQRVQAQLSDAFLRIAILETRIDDLMKENYELKLEMDSDSPDVTMEANV